MSLEVRLEIMKSLKFRELGTVIIGSILIGVGIVISFIANIGADPLSGVYNVTANVLKQKLGVGTLAVSLLMLLVAFIYKRKLIGVATFLNPLCISLIIMFAPVVSIPNKLYLEVAVLMIGFSVLSFGTALYIIGNQGAAPYDSSIIIIADSLNTSYGKAKMILDTIFVLIAVVYFEKVDIAPFIAILFIGPTIDFFMKRLQPYFRKTR